MFKAASKSLLNGADALEVLVLNFEFRSFEFVSDFGFWISDFLNFKRSWF